LLLVRPGLEDALSRGQVSWQGLVRSIDYLDLDVPIKRIVGKWWRKWVKTESQATRPGSGPSEAWFDEQDDDEEGDGIGRGKSIRGDDGNSDGEEDDMAGGGEIRRPEIHSDSYSFSSAPNISSPIPSASSL
jgi:hypothetical protein